MATYKNHSFEIELNTNEKFDLQGFIPSGESIKAISNKMTPSPKAIGDQAIAIVSTNKPMVGAEHTIVGVVTWIRPKKVFLKNSETGELAIFQENTLYHYQNGTVTSIEDLRITCQCKGDVLECLQSWNKNWSKVDFTEEFEPVLEWINP